MYPITPLWFPYERSEGVVKRTRLRLLSLFFVLFIIRPASAQSLTFTDMAGRELSVSIPLRRIACLGPGSLRLMVYLQAGDRIVGVEEIEKKRPAGRPYILAHPEIARLPRIGPGGPSGTNQKPDLEALLRLKPQAIFVTYLEASQAEALQQTLGIPVVVLRYGRSATFDDAVFESLLLAGKLIGEQERAKELLDYIQALRSDLQKRGADFASERRTAYVGGVSYRGAYGIESTERSYIPMLWANVTNVAEAVETKLGSHAFIDKEKLLALNPGTIFVDAAGLELIGEDYRKHPDFYRSLKACKNRRVFVLLPFNSYSTNIETALADAYAIGKALYPEGFRDIDPEKRTDEIYRFMVGRSVYQSMKKSFAPIGSLAPFCATAQSKPRE
ncbi:MAG: iron ABC transporter substrate-binding protein [Deltaproteobacteria bacterium]|nr:iron ABC transporter substrate-binding protein [Deltaproteobacteria bacterium]